MNGLRKKERCPTCRGSKTMMGGGMMMIDCDNCEGLGYIIKAEDEMEYLVTHAKKTESYSKAKIELKKIDENLSDAEAEKILDDEISKQKVNKKRD